MTASRSIARLKVTLKDVEPPVVRRLEVPLKIRLDRLHLVLQAAMGWSNTHLYEFTATGIGWGEPDPDAWDDILPAAKTTLLDVIEDTGVKTLHYIYDFGDHWDHVVKVEKIATAIPGMTYPWMFLGEGRCPPEDVGGPPGYAEFLKAMASPDQQHDHPSAQDGWTTDLKTMEEVNLSSAVDQLAKKWAPRPRRPKAPPRRP